MSLSAEQIAYRAAQQDARNQAVADARRAADLERRVAVGDLAEDRRTRQALRQEEHVSMAGWVTPTGAALPVDVGGVTVTLPPGTIATRDPAAGGIVDPAVRVVPGLTYVVTATAEGERTYLGLQWINGDGTVNPAILWTRADGRTRVSGAAPDTARGVRALLVNYSVASGDLLGKDTPTKVAMQHLRQWLLANRPEEA